MLHDFDEIDAILDQLWVEGMAADPMIEPVDDPDCQIDFWDWAQILGIVDEFEPEEYYA